VVREILFFQPRRRGTDLSTALRTLNRVIKRSAICFLFTDFLQPEPAENGTVPSIPEETGRLLRITARRHELICLELLDRRELELPNVGIVTLEDAESGDLIEVDTANPRFRRLYADRNQERLNQTASLLNRLGVDHLRLQTGVPYIRDLRLFLQKRDRRR